MIAEKNMDTSIQVSHILEINFIDKIRGIESVIIYDRLDTLAGIPWMR